jgi:ATP-dependent Lon protease
MKLHFVETMDEVLRIALEREIVALPIPPVEMGARPSEEKLTH